MITIGRIVDVFAKNAVDSRIPLSREKFLKIYVF